VRVTRETIPGHLGIDLCVSLESVLQFLKHDNRSALANDKAIALAVKRPGRPRGVLIERGRERPQPAKPRHRQRGHACLCSACDHDVRIAVADEPGGIADGMQSRRARCRYGMVGSLRNVD